MFWIYDIRCGTFNEDLERFKENLNDPEKVLDCISRSVVAVAEILKKKYEQLRLYSLFTCILLVFDVMSLLYSLV